MGQEAPGRGAVPLSYSLFLLPMVVRERPMVEFRSLAGEEMM